MDDDEDIDYEELDNDVKKGGPDDFMSILLGVVALSNLKLAFFIFIIFLFVTSDIFTEHVLHKFSDNVYNDQVKCTMIQATVLVLLFLTFDVFIKAGFL